MNGKTTGSLNSRAVNRPRRWGKPVSLCLITLILLAWTITLARASTPRALPDLRQALRQVENLDAKALESNQQLTNAIQDAQQKFTKLVANLSTLETQAVIDQLKTLRELMSLALQNLKPDQAALAYVHFSAAYQSVNDAIESHAAPYPGDVNLAGLVVAVADRVGGMLAALTAWPVVVLIVGLIALGTQRGFEQLSRFAHHFKSFKLPGGVEAVLTEENSQALSSSFEDAFDALRGEINRSYALENRKCNLRGRFVRLMQSTLESKIKKLLPANAINNLRATIHVQDVLFQDSLYQLLDYYPKGGGAGRTWSIRFGMIGRAWRLCTNNTSSEVSPKEDGLVKEWGMMLEEARNVGSNAKFVSCTLLRPVGETEPVASVYLELDSNEQLKKLDEPMLTRLHTLIEEECRTQNLTKDIAGVTRDLRSRSPLIRFHESTSSAK